MSNELDAACRSCAKTILEMHQKSEMGHIASSLSCLEILVDLCLRRMKEPDALILSKGHAASALYAVLAKSGRMNPESLSGFCTNGTFLAAHPPSEGQIPCIPFGTGSLGHGLSLAAGLSFSQRFTGRQFHVYCVLSDGDCNEGATWEAALFAGHHRLSNLTVILDQNGLQGLGRSSDILTLEPVSDKWSSFGFEVRTAANGNDLDSIDRAFSEFPADGAKPRCVVAKTIKGHGISFMKDRLEWHYLPMTQEQFVQALKEVEVRR